MSGSSTLGNINCYQPGIECSQSGIYGSLGQSGTGNVPGGRIGAVGSFDNNGNLWIFGGENQVNGVENLMNDLWKFNPQTKQWAWMTGSATPTCGAKTNSGNCVANGEYGVYGTLRVPTPVNVPGSREDAASWSDRNGHLWLFGGEGFDSIGSLWPLNDLWEYQLKQNPAVALTFSANPVFAQNPITLTASVTASGTAPTGTVTFLDGTTSIGTDTLNSSGSSTLSVNTLTVGSHTITASYAGDTNNFAANAPLTEVVEDFSIAAGATTTATIKSGSSATYTFTFNPIAPATTFPSALTLSASGGPAGSTYTLSPTTITSGASSTPVTLTVAIPSSASSVINPPDRPGAPLSLPLALATLLLPLAARLRKADKRIRGIAPLWFLLAIGIAASTSLSGCSGGSSAVPSQSQTYTITMTGTADALSHSTFVTLTVN